MTNLEWLRSLPAEELWEYIDCEKAIKSCPFDVGEDVNCKACVIGWLNQERDGSSRRCKTCRYDGLLFDIDRCNSCLSDLTTDYLTEWKPLMWPQRAYRKVMNWLRRRAKK